RPEPPFVPAGFVPPATSRTDTDPRLRTLRNPFPRFRHVLMQRQIAVWAAARGFDGTPKIQPVQHFPKLSSRIRRAHVIKMRPPPPRRRIPAQPYPWGIPPFCGPAPLLFPVDHIEAA